MTEQEGRGTHKHLERVLAEALHATCDWEHYIGHEPSERDDLLAANMAGWLKARGYELRLIAASGAANPERDGRWTHKHTVDPHYETTGKPAYWVCHTCRTELLLDGGKPPITAPPVDAEPKAEPPLSSQP